MALLTKTITPAREWYVALGGAVLSSLQVLSTRGCDEGGQRFPTAVGATATLKQIPVSQSAWASFMYERMAASLSSLDTNTTSIFLAPSSLRSLYRSFRIGVNA